MDLQVPQLNCTKYISDLLVALLGDVKHRVMKKDMDWLAIADGLEGVGKSVFSQQAAFYLDPKFDIERIHFSTRTLMDQAVTLPKGSAIVLDEAFMDINSKESMSEVARSIAAFSTEMRQLNLFMFICIPSFFDLLRSFAIRRTSCLFNIYFDEDYNRGHAIVFPRPQKLRLYIQGKKFYDYGCVPSPYLPFRFHEWYPVDEEEYRKRKRKALRERYEDNIAGTGSEMTKRLTAQRAALVNYLIDNHFVPVKRTEDALTNVNEVLNMYKLNPITFAVLQDIRRHRIKEAISDVMSDVSKPDDMETKPENE